LQRSVAERQVAHSSCKTGRSRVPADNYETKLTL